MDLGSVAANSVLDPLGCRHFIQIARRYTDYEVDGFIDLKLELVVVDVAESVRHCPRQALVAIRQRMILDNAYDKHASLLSETGVELNVSKGSLRRKERGFEQIKAGHTRKSRSWNPRNR